MNNGYQKSNGCGADKEGGKFFNTFFCQNAQSKHVRTLAYNVPMLYEGGEIDAHPVSLAQMTNKCTTIQLQNAAPLLYSICWQQYFNYYEKILSILR